MRMASLLGLGLALPLSLVILVNCQTTATIDSAIQQNLPQICSAAETAHIAFTAVAEDGRLSARTVNREEAAWLAISGLCVNPSQASTVSVLIAATTAYASITTAMREAERVERIE